MLNRTPGTGEGGKDERGGRRKPGRAQAPGMLPASLPEPHGHAAGHGLPRQSARPVPGCPHRGASKRAVRGREQAWGGGGRQPALGLGAHADGRTDRWMDGAAQHARGKARVRHGTNLRAGLSGAGAGSSLERSAAGERTRRDVTPPGARRPLLPSSSAPRAPRLAALPLPCQLAPEWQVPVPPQQRRALGAGSCWPLHEDPGARVGCVGGGDPTSDGGGEAAAHTDGAGGRQHFGVPRLVLRVGIGSGGAAPPLASPQPLPVCPLTS